MKYRMLGRTGMNVAEISFGAWAIGGSWGEVDDQQSMAALHKAVDVGVNFFDTADVYGDGRSEKLIAQLRRERPGETIYVATKAGRRLDPHTADGYNAANLTAFVDRSLQYLEMDALDLVQLHCPPSAVYDRPEVFEALDNLQAQGKIKHYGVSVEKVTEAIKAIQYPNVKTVQIIFNIFRQKPIDAFLREAGAKHVGVLARVPLASGLLTGKITRDTEFAADDHRNFNRYGQAFDVGETFSGVDLDAAFNALDGIAPMVPPGWTMAQFALRWILMFDAVTCAIPGAKRPEQVVDNAAAADMPPIDQDVMESTRVIYDTYIKPSVHTRW
ncbi:MAG: aldo/keto reductase [Anaerolineales bacterium]|nr:aldo/keto reductase [Anaerolineales bacterium]